MRRLFWCALHALLLISISLRVRGFNATRDRLQHKLSRDRQEHPDLSVAQIVQQTCRMTKAAVHYGWFHATCLEQSLTLWYLLQKQSIPTDLRIGARKAAGKFEAHAWVMRVHAESFRQRVR